MRAFGALLAALLLGVVLPVQQAVATPAQDALAALRSGSLYVEKDAQNGYGKPVVADADAASAALDATVKVAVFATGTDAANAVETLMRGVTTGRVLIVFVGSRYELRYRSCPSSLEEVATVVNTHAAELRVGSYTDLLVAIGRGVHCGAAAGVTSTGGGHGSAGKKGSSGALVTAALIGGVGLLGVAGVGGVLRGRKRRKRQQLAAARAEVMPYYDRLASDVNTLDGGTDPLARQTLADTSERYTSAGGQMATADSRAQWAAARRTVLEGLQAAQAARQALGIHCGPSLPPIDAPRGEQLAEQRTVEVAGKQYRGYPRYTPGAPHYFAGGGGYAGGWYTFPFWETLLIGSMIGGGWRFGGGGYGSGDASGYDAGSSQADAVDDASAADSSGADHSGDWSGDVGGGDVGGGGSSAGGRCRR